MVQGFEKKPERRKKFDTIRVPYFKQKCNYDQKGKRQIHGLLFDKGDWF